jgi:hypothetical protein
MIAPVDRLEIKIRAENEKGDAPRIPFQTFWSTGLSEGFPFPISRAYRLETVRGD